MVSVYIESLSRSSTHIFNKQMQESHVKELQMFHKGVWIKTANLCFNFKPDLRQVPQKWKSEYNLRPFLSLGQIPPALIYQSPKV